MELKNDDPKYYKDEICRLIQQAIANGLELQVDKQGISDKVILSFKNNRNECAGIEFTQK